MLGLEIREVRVVAREDIRKSERQNLHASRSTRTQVSSTSAAFPHQETHAPADVKTSQLAVQVKNLEHQLGDTEKRLQEMVTASQRQTNIAQHEVQPLGVIKQDVAINAAMPQ